MPIHVMLRLTWQQCYNKCVNKNNNKTTTYKAQ